VIEQPYAEGGGSFSVELDRLVVAHRRGCGGSPCGLVPASPWGRLFRLVPESRFCVKQSLMAIGVKHKKRGRGRPAIGHSPIVGVRMPPEERRAVEAWAAEQEDKPSLSKAIRHLVALALAAEMKRRR
jgi:hypothetical protein